MLVHGILLAVHFTAPDAFKFKPIDPGLEVILVNAKHDKKPLKADALAQANLDGGGNAATGRAKSPLPDMRKNENGEGLKAMQRRVEELEKRQQMLTQTNKKKRPTVSETKDGVTPKDKPPQPTGADLFDSAAELQRREAEIAKSIEEYNKRPKKTMISPSTKETGYAMYYNSLREKIEKIGTVNFPQKNGKKMYGELVISIPIYQDGTIYTKEGGLTVERSSGNKDLDEKAKQIVRSAAPFAKFPQNMRSTGKDDVWVLVTSFKFTREGELEANLSGSSGN